MVIHRFTLFILLLFYSVSFADDDSSLTLDILNTLNRKLEAYEGVADSDSSVVAKDRSRIKREILVIIDALTNESNSTFIELIKDKYNLDEIPHSVSVQVLSELYQSNQSNPRYSLNSSIEVALAGLGDEEAFLNIADGLKSENTTIRNQTFFKLANVHTPRSLELLGAFLMGETSEAFIATARLGHSFDMPSSEVYAMMALREEFGELESNRRISTAEKLKNWKRWWKEGHWKEHLVSESKGDAAMVEAFEVPKPEVKESAEVVLVEIAEEATEQPSQWWLWLVGLLVILGGIALVVRRKN